MDVTKEETWHAAQAELLRVLKPFTKKEAIGLLEATIKIATDAKE